MLKIVLDASVVLAWLVEAQEKKFEGTHIIYNHILKGEIEVFAPTFLLVEVLNVLIMKKKIKLSVTKKFIDNLQKSGIRFQNLEFKEIGSLADIGWKYKITSYDTLYLLTAIRNKCLLVTFDDQLLHLTKLTMSMEECLKRIKNETGAADLQTV